MEGMAGPRIVHRAGGGHQRLAGHAGFDTIFSAVDTAGINKHKQLVIPDHAFIVAVSGHPWRRINQGLTGPGYPIEQCGLPDIGPANQGDDGICLFRHEYFLCRKNGVFTLKGIALHDFYPSLSVFRRPRWLQLPYQPSIVRPEKMQRKGP